MQLQTDKKAEAIDMYSYEPRELVHPDCPNFFMYEVFKSSTAAREGIDNTEGFGADHRASAQAIVSNVLQPLRNKFGKVLLSSWYRSPELERLVCAKSYRAWLYRNHKQATEMNWLAYCATKSHPTGGAVDTEIPGIISVLGLYEYMKLNYRYDQLIREYASDSDPDAGWIHVSWRSSRDNRNDSFKRP